MTMESEDEMCDLETLEALLEDDYDESVSAKNHDDNLERNNHNDHTELDILAHLSAEYDFEETSPSDFNKQCIPDTSDLDIQPSNSSKPPALCENSSFPKATGYNVSSEKISNLQNKLNAKHGVSSKEVLSKSECIKDSNLTPQALLQEMAKMQQKMLELQKMLEQQQAKQHIPPHNDIQHGNVQDKLKESVLDQNVPPRNKAEPKKVLPSSRANEIKTKSTISGSSTISSLRLISDNDDFLFSQSSTSSSTTPQSAQKKMKKKVDGSSSEKVQTGRDKMKKVDGSSSEKVQTGRDRMKKDLFGDSDSDWEMDGEDKQTLSESGRDIQLLLHSNQQKRDAHKPMFNMSDSCSGSSQAWARSFSEVDLDAGRRTSFDGAKDVQKDNKNLLQCKTSSNDQAKPTTKVLPNEQFITENFSKIRIVNPLISSSLMKLRMEGRKMINVSRIHTKLKTPDLQSDWVTVAVIVGKTDSKSSSSGKPYSIWKLNDLEDLDNSVSFFLFGEVHKHLWKTEVGTVIGVLNPSIMEPMEKKSSEPAFTIKNQGQLMIMGLSKDLGWCTGRTKKGNKCAKFINKKFGDCCAYHVQAAYRKVSATRLELHGSVAGIKPKSFEQKIFSKDCAYIYGGQTFVPHSNSKSKKGVTLSTLQKNMSTSKLNKISTMSLHNISPAPLNSQKGGKIKDDTDNTFIDMISVPSPGSMNLVAFLKNKEENSSHSKRPASRSKHTFQVQSITPQEMLKQHQQLMQQKKTPKRKASDELLADSKILPKKLHSNNHQDIAKSAVATKDALSQVPILAKGFYGGQDISLDISSKLMSVADRAKLKAVLAVKEKGGIRQEDPNAIKKSDLDVEKIQKRVQNNGKQSSQENVSSPQPSAHTDEPPKKKSRLLGNVNLNSSEIKDILKARSRHKGALSEAEAEREEVYFNELEKKEKLEEKMLSVTSIEITVVTCKQCLYTAQSAKDSCKTEGHTLTRSKTKKRFFMCKKCKHRSYVIGGKFPTEACRKCGAQSFEKTSMHKVRAGPTLESEVLNIRGDEIKYLNSMDQKVFLQTVVDS